VIQSENRSRLITIGEKKLCGVERKLFGQIDARGALAVRAFMGDDAGGWHAHFKTFFEYLDIQKIRTPKGLDWLSAQYPRLPQNDLMFEMQGVRRMHCTIWVEGVREIVSAQDADVKFIVSDHPVTIYKVSNRALAAISPLPHSVRIDLYSESHACYAIKSAEQQPSKLRSIACG
jgi:hypothetical protein